MYDLLVNVVIKFLDFDLAIRLCPFHFSIDGLTHFRLKIVKILVISNFVNQHKRSKII